jgi:hypothetical protein
MSEPTQTADPDGEGRPALTKMWIGMHLDHARMSKEAARHWFARVTGEEKVGRLGSWSMWAKMVLVRASMRELGMEESEEWAEIEGESVHHVCSYLGVAKHLRSILERSYAKDACGSEWWMLQRQRALAQATAVLGVAKADDKRRRHEASERVGP